MAQDFTTLIELVRRYSPSGQEQAAVDYLLGRMAELGFTRTYRDEVGNAVGVMGKGPRQIVLLGHIDTVPGEIPVSLAPLTSTPPAPLPLSQWERGRGVADRPGGGGEGSEGVLHGRGSVDAKGPLAAFVDAVAAVGAVDGWQLVVIGAVDEERDSTGARHLAASGAYRPEYAIIGEPNRWERVALGYKGTAWAEVTVTCPQAHTASGQQTAAEAAVTFWLAVKAHAGAFNTGKPRPFDQLLPTLRGIQSGEDGFSQWARLRIGCRLPVEVGPEAWYAVLREQTSEVLKTSEVSINPLGHPVPAWRGERNTPLVRAFLGAIRAAGGKPGFVRKTGTADVNIVAPAWKCPAVVYGPGDSALDHTPREHISLAEYARAVEVLVHVLRRLTG